MLIGINQRFWWFSRLKQSQGFVFIILMHCKCHSSGVARHIFVPIGPLFCLCFAFIFVKKDLWTFIIFRRSCWEACNCHASQPTNRRLVLFPFHTTIHAYWFVCNDSYNQKNQLQLLPVSPATMCNECNCYLIINVLTIWKQTQHMQKEKKE